MIKHLVFSGGGPSFIQTISSLYYLLQHQYIQFEHIKTIYGTSSGTLSAILFALQFEEEIVRDYIIKRPWEKVFCIHIDNLFQIYNTLAIFPKEILKIILEPLFLSKDIPISISLEEFFLLTKIEIHFIVFEMNEFKSDDISYLTHPHLSVVDAVQMSCSIPFVFPPFLLNDKCYIDGGFCDNYPLSYCKYPKESILGFKNKYEQDISHYQMNDKSNLIDYISCFIYQFLNKLANQPPSIPNEIICDVEMFTFTYLQKFIFSQEERNQYYMKGIENAQQYLFKNEDKKNII
jgi:predicted acylesterase/phospholipase RssA